MEHIKKIFTIVTMLVIIIGIVILGLRTFVYKDNYIEIIENNTDIDKYIILSIIKVESNFNSNATSIKGASGLMQLMPDTYNDMSNDNNIYNIESNIKAGIKYFGLLLNRYNNKYIAILAYNAGIGNVDKWLKEGIIDNDLDTHIVHEIPYKESKNYLKKVINTFNIYTLIY